MKKLYKVKLSSAQNIIKNYNENDIVVERKKKNRVFNNNPENNLLRRKKYLEERICKLQNQPLMHEVLIKTLERRLKKVLTQIRRNSL